MFDSFSLKYDLIRSPYEKSLAQNSEKGPFSEFFMRGGGGSAHGLDNGNPPLESMQGRKRYWLVLICILGLDRRFSFAIQSRLAKQRDLKEYKQ